MSGCESPRQPGEAIHETICQPGDGWLYRLQAGMRLRIVDLEGNQAADTLFFDASDVQNRYSAVDTMCAAGQAYLQAGSRLLGSRGTELARIVADTCGRHDTVGGACACESNQVRYDLGKRSMHACRETFLRLLATSPLARLAPGGPMGKRDLSHNINFFMNVPITADGGLSFADGISAPGRYVEIEATRPLLCLISNCPQLNNPCNGWNPTPIQLLVWDAEQ